MEELIYLDNAATSFPKPESVHTAVRDFYSKYGVNPGRSGCDLGITAEQMIHGTRKRLSAFFNRSLAETGKAKDPNRLVFTLNATMALNLIVNGTVEPGDHIVTTVLEHNSVIRPVNHRVLAGAEAAYVRPDAEGYVDPEEIRRAIKKNTKLVIVNHASNVTGVVQGLSAIGAVCREQGVPFAIDASQSAGKIPVDIEKLCVDIVAFTGHKSLLGPTGIGGLYVREGIDIRHTRAGGTGVRSADRMHLDEYPYRLEYGTGNVVGIAGLNAGLKWITKKGLAQIHTHEMKLARMFAEGLGKMDGVSLYCQDDLADHIAIVSFNIDGMDALNVGTLLDGEYDIACRTGLHCAPLVHEQLGTAQIGGSVRIGIGPFNTEDHIRAAIDAVGEILEFQKKK